MMQRTITAAVRRARTTCAVCIVLLTCISVAWAQDAEFARKLTLKEAATLAVGNSRDLAPAPLPYGLGQRQAGAAGAVSRPNCYTRPGPAETTGPPFLQASGSHALF